jgi:hypothetical protein
MKKNIGVSLLFIIVLVIALLIAMRYIGFVPRRDILECEAPNGHRFTFESRYEWWPLAIFARHSSSKENQTLKIFYHKNTSLFLPLKAGAYFDFSDDNSRFRKICSNVGLSHNHPVVTYQYFQSGVWLRINTQSNPELYFSSTLSEVPSSIRMQLIQLSATAELNYAFAVPTQKYLVFEHPATDGKSVVAVIKSKSFDGGKTWQDPLVTKDAEIFEIGKSLIDQPFIGRPIRFNGRRIHWKNLPTEE